MLPPIAPIATTKEIMRLKMKSVRRQAHAARSDAPPHAARNFLAHVAVAPGAIVSLYHPIGDELDTEPLAAALLETGARIALPVTPRGWGVLTFRAYVPGDALDKGTKGVLQPGPSAEAVRPDIVVAPLLAFTCKGDRLGYGGGYYDRTLADLRKHGPVLAVGYGFAAQEVDALPSSPQDEKLDLIVTEARAIETPRFGDNVLFRG